MHANNFRSVHNIQGETIPEVLEIKFLRNDRNQFEDYHGPFACSLDFSICPKTPDIILKW